MRYIIVLHFWFMDSKGFEVIDSDAKTYEDVLKEAIVLKHEKGSTFNKCQFKIIEIGSEEVLKTSYDHDLLKIPKWIRKIFT